LLMAGMLGEVHAAVQDAPIAVPFDFQRHEVLVQATVNGQGPFPMLLDTGTNPSVIDLALARRLGLSLTLAGRSGSGGGTEKSLLYVTSLPSVDLGGLSAANVDALAMDLSALSRRFGQPIRGVLGHSLLLGHVVQFDYPARTVRFLSAIPAPTGTVTRTLLPIQVEDCVQARGIRVNGQPVIANIDTGSNNTFQFTPSAVRRLGLSAQERRARPANGAGFNGGFTSRIGTVDAITIGTLRLTRPAVTFWQPSTGHDDVFYDINIGNVILSRYVLTIDYSRKRLALDSPRPPLPR
jgi:predicted aspartyl protease